MTVLRQRVAISSEYRLLSRAYRFSNAARGTSARSCTGIVGQDSRAGRQLSNGVRWTSGCYTKDSVPWTVARG